MKRHWFLFLTLPIALSAAVSSKAAGNDCACPCPPPPTFDPCAPVYVGGPSIKGSPPIVAPTDQEAAAAPSPSEESDTAAPAPTPEADLSFTPAPLTDFASTPSTARSFNSGLVMGSSSAFSSVGGYIDDALIRTRVRTRFDSVDGGDSDRAEFLYATYNEAAIGIVGLGGLEGPALSIPRRIDYEELTTLLEVALTERFSIFAEIGVRWNDVDSIAAAPGFDPSDQGLGDMNAGLKYALRETCNDILTFQFRVLIPTGDDEQLLGTGHASLMPGLLYQEQVTERFTFFGEIHDWIGLGTTELPNGDDFGGNVLRYGLGFGYDLIRHRDCCGNVKRFTWVNEFVGWTVLEGQRITPPGDGGLLAIVDAEGDTIVNYKTGLRLSDQKNALYVGYGFAMTDDVWYDDVIRVQWERFF
jgi:hypothetical protein